jgi:hypothetical protein
MLARQAKFMKLGRADSKRDSEGAGGLERILPSARQSDAPLRLIGSVPYLKMKVAWPCPNGVEACG